MTQALEIQWPHYYQPANSPVHVRNELDIAASQDRAWAWLTRVTQWPSWYHNSANIEILEGSGVELVEAMQFRWKTFGITITSTVLEYIPNERIAWDAHALCLNAYHAWVLQPSTNGCRILTEESQHGWLARLSNLFMPDRMSKYHQRWLEALERQAVKGLPPAISD